MKYLREECDEIGLFLSFKIGSCVGCSVLSMAQGARCLSY